MENVKILEVSNTKFELLLWKLRDAIKDSKIEFKTILCVGRGGSIVGSWLSHQLGDVSTAFIASRRGTEATGNVEDRTKVGEVSTIDGLILPLLIVDDVSDRGDTLDGILSVVRKVTNMGLTSEIKCAALFMKPWSKRKPDFVAKETEDWIVFPWEAK